MKVRGLTFVGTSTDAREPMARFVRDVLGLPPLPVEGSGHDFFALPDSSTFAVGPSGGPDAWGGDSRTIGFLVDDVDEAAAELRAAGVPTDDDVSVNARYRYTHFRAPDGHVYELVEKLEPAAESAHLPG
jgi:catechol 2,3-dioxygenase-like lactoylglutathione lyase family enzyme